MTKNTATTETAGNHRTSDYGTLNHKYIKKSVIISPLIVTTLVEHLPFYQSCRQKEANETWRTFDAVQISDFFDSLT